MSKLVIVESSGKIKKIQAALPKEFVVKSSNGHIRDLPDNASELPEELRHEQWSKLGVDINNDFHAYYVLKDSARAISELRKSMQKADELYLATDGDREGEAISWHLLETLQPKIPTHRMVFREITKEAIQKAIKTTREVDYNLVEAQETRRILDRLIGYPLSLLLGKKITYGLSAGRVQCPVIRLVVDRERERRAFKSGSYWDLKANLITPNGNFDADLYSIDDKRLATGADFDKDTGKIAKGKDVLLLGEKEAKDLVKSLKTKTFKLIDIRERQFETKPSPPFMTSSLQIEASRKLNMDGNTTMSVAQKLYESGWITYMRTDSVNLSNEAVTAARKEVTKLYGKDYLSPKPKVYTTKSKSGVNAQEAHEAIRPAGAEFIHPDQSGLKGTMLKLYDLIWKRTVACQMANAQKTSTTYELDVEIDGKRLVFRANGTTINFPGYMRAYVEGSDDPAAALDNQDSTLPKADVGDSLDCKKVAANGHETQPPPRYTQSSLQKRLEDEGIGRPSTYATFYQKITDGRYGHVSGKAIIPTFTAFAVADFFAKHFPSVMELSFTANMESELDQIAAGGETKTQYLREFYSKAGGFADMIDKGELEISADEVKVVNIDGIDDFIIRIGPYGAYAQLKADEHRKVDIPKEIAPADVTDQQLHDLLDMREAGPQSIGVDPETGLDVFLKHGRFGHYLQLGEQTDENPKPKTGSLLRGMTPESCTIEQALQILSLPRVIGEHPDGGSIETNIGRYGAYVRYKKEYRSLKSDAEVFSITLQEGLDLLSQPKTRGGSSPKAALRDFGEVDGESVQILDGRYGPYVKMGKTNATLPKDLTPDACTLERAIELIEEKRAKGDTKKTTKKSTTKKATTKKAASKKEEGEVEEKPKKTTKKAATTKKATTKTATKTAAKKTTTAKKTTAKKTTTKTTRSKKQEEES